MSASPHKEISLYFTEGTSDKFYRLRIVPEGAGWLVMFQNGKRGTEPKFKPKTPAPVTLEEAETVFTKAVKEKEAKGYTEDESGRVFAGTDKASRVTEVRPQLLNDVPADDVKHATDWAGWCMQQKHDGERMLVCVQDGAATGISRKGLARVLPPGVAAASLAAGHAPLTLDGEKVGDHLFVWDVLEMDGRSLANQPLSARLQTLASLALDGAAITTVETWTEAAEKAAAMERLHAAGAEGVVFKDLSAPYTPGRPASGGAAMKHKFVASATFRVKAISKGKRSVEMEMLDGQDWVGVGAVQIPPNHDIPPVSAFAECTYLYAHRGGSLSQPRYKGVRDDQDEEDCGIRQLQYKEEARPAARPRLR